MVDSAGTISDMRNVDKTDETYRDYIILGTISIYMSAHLTYARQHVKQTGGFTWAQKLKEKKGLSV